MCYFLFGIFRSINDWLRCYDTHTTDECKNIKQADVYVMNAQSQLLVPRATAYACVSQQYMHIWKTQPAKSSE